MESRRDIAAEVLGIEVEAPDHILRSADPEKTLKDLRARMEVAVQKNRPRRERVREFLAGESIAGRSVGAVADFITIMLPWGHRVNTGREAVRLVLNRKRKTEVHMDRLQKLLKQKSTKAGIIVVASILALFGVNINPELLGEHLNEIVAGLAMAFAAAAGLYETLRQEPDEDE
jgi:hypothetical protein